MNDSIIPKSIQNDVQTCTVAELLYWAALICQSLIDLETKWKDIPDLINDKDFYRAIKWKNKFVNSYLPLCKKNNYKF